MTYNKRPWLTEPNTKLWTHNGITCYIKRMPYSGHLCGYIAVPKGHPFHGTDAYELDIDCHGGVTYASGIMRNAPKGFEGYWCIGFDCNHSGDLCPVHFENILKLGPAYDFDGTQGLIYRDMNFCTEQCNSMAEQAISALPN